MLTKTNYILLGISLFINFQLFGQFQKKNSTETSLNLNTLDSKWEFPKINRKVDFDKGLIFFGGLGFSKEVKHFGVNINLAWQTRKGWEFGLDFGGHNNVLDIPINNENELLEISSTPVFIQSKFFFTHFFENMIKPYAKFSIGYGFNNGPDETSYSGNGIMFDYGIGTQVRINRKNFFYIECSQYNFKAKGSVNNPNDNLELQFNVWFNDVIFRLGFGRRLFQS